MVGNLPVPAEHQEPGGVPLKDDVGALLAANRQRYTRGRQLIIEVLADAGQPLSLAAIVARCPRLAASSTYRNLGLLETYGVVRRILDGDGVAHFELSEAITGHHHHAVCRRCGAMQRVHLPAALEQGLDSLAEGLSQAGDFELSEHRVELIGVCGACR